MEVLHEAVSGFPKMDDEQFTIWAELLEERTGMHLPKERRSFLETSIGLRMREIGLKAYSDYYVQLLATRNGSHEWQTLVDRLTIHETRFFRHVPSLELLEKVILPEIMDRKTDRDALKIWSAGCSTGEETYTLAMIAMDYIFSWKTQKQAVDNMRCYLSVTGMDISIPALVTAKKAVYDRYKIRQIPSSYMKKYFEPYDNGCFRVIDTLKKRICFVPFNIIDMGRTLLQQMDIIFCQNVLIYFNRERRRQIISCLLERLKPGGYLVLGAGEITRVSLPGLDKVDFPQSLAFRKK